MHTTIFTATPSSKSILDTKSSTRVVPCQCIILADDHTRTTFQASLVIDKHFIAFVVVRIQMGRTYIEAGSQSALLPANIMIDDDMRGVLIDLEDIASKLVL
jgi:hypothetical protein